MPLDHGRLGGVRRAAGKPPSVGSHHPSEPSTRPSLGDDPSEVARPPAVARFTSSIPPRGGGVMRRCCQPCLAPRYRRATRLLGPGRFVVRSPGRARADFPRPARAGRDAMATRLTLRSGSTESRTPISRLRTARPDPLADGASVDLLVQAERSRGPWNRTREELAYQTSERPSLTSPRCVAPRSGIEPLSSRRQRDVLADERTGQVTTEMAGFEPAGRSPDLRRSTAPPSAARPHLQ